MINSYRETEYVIWVKQVIFIFTRMATDMLESKAIFLFACHFHLCHSSTLIVDTLRVRLSLTEWQWPQLALEYMKQVARCPLLLNML